MAKKNQAAPKDISEQDSHNEETVYSDDEILPEVKELTSDRLKGEMRDRVLGWIKAMQKPWQQMSEMEQRNFAGAIESSCAGIIREAVNIIAANGRKCIVSTLEQYTEKDGLKITLKAFGKGETVAALHEACGREVLLVATGAEEFLGADDPEIDGDQAPLFDETMLGKSGEFSQNNSFGSGIESE